MNPPAERRGDDRLPQPWTSPQRRALVVLVVVLLAVGSLRFALHPSYVSDPQPEWPQRYDELADRIDPNLADWTELGALPGIGERRAKEIIAYREHFLAESTDPIAFRRAEDLANVRGIGPAIVNTIRPYLIFPGPAEAGEPPAP